MRNKLLFLFALLTAALFAQVGPVSGIQPVNKGGTGASTAAGARANLGLSKADEIEAMTFAQDSGSTDAYAATLTPAITAYVTGVHYRFKANTANTGAATINLNALGAKTIKKVAGGITTDLADNDIRSGQWVDVVYDGTNMQMQSTLGNAASSGTTTSLKITYTGTPQTPLVLPVEPGIAIVPVAAVGGQATYTAGAGPVISAFGYSEINTLYGNRLLTLSFDDLAGVSGAFNPGAMSALTALQANTLINVGGSFGPTNLAALTTLQANALTYAGAFNPSSMAALPTLQVNALTNVGGNFGPSSMASLTTLQANALVNVGGNFSPATMAALPTLQVNALANVGGNFNPNAMASLTTLQANALVNVGGIFGPATMAALTTLQVNALANVGGNFSPNTMAALTTLQANALTNVGGTFSPNTMGSLATLQFDALQTIGGAVSPSAMAACTTVSLAGMVTYGSTITIPSVGMGAVTTLTLGTIGTLKTITGATVTLSGLALNQTSVDNCLKLLDSLDGTGGTTSFGTGKTVTLNGGTNASPTTTGMVSQTSAGSNFSAAGTTCTANVTAHGLTTGDIITVTGITTLTNANVTAATATVVNANQFTFPIASQTAPGAGTATIRSTSTGNTSGFRSVQNLRLRGATITTAAGF